MAPKVNSGTPAKKPRSEGWALNRARTLLQFLFNLNLWEKAKETREKSRIGLTTDRKKHARVVWWIIDPDSADPIALADLPSADNLSRIATFTDNDIIPVYKKLYTPYTTIYKFLRVNRTTKPEVLEKNKAYKEPKPGGRGYVPYIGVAMYSLITDSESEFDSLRDALIFTNISRVTRVQRVLEFDYNMFVDEIGESLRSAGTDSPGNKVIALIVDVLFKHPLAAKATPKKGKKK